MQRFEAAAEAVGSKRPGRVALEPESFGNRSAEEGIAERCQDQAERRFRHSMLLMIEGQLIDQRPDRLEDWVERVAVAGEDHPRREGASALLAERVESLVDDLAGVDLAGAGKLDASADASSDIIGDRSR